MIPEILFEDNHLIVVYKERGVLSQADHTKAMDMLTIIKRYLKEKYQKPGEAFLGLVHRLDRNTSGVMVFAKTSKGAARLAEAMKAGQFRKKYHAIVEGNPKPAKLVHRLAKDNKERKSYLSVDGQEAMLDFSVIKSLSIEGVLCSMLDITLYTGRFHQIRVQLAAYGHPLFGDCKYGSRYKYPYYLDCYELSFPHPITKEMLIFKHKKEGQ